MEKSRKELLREWIIDAWHQVELNSQELPLYPGLFCLIASDEEDQILLHVDIATESIESSIHTTKLSPILEMMDRAKESSSALTIHVNSWCFPSFDAGLVSFEALNRMKEEIVRQLNPILQDKALLKMLNEIEVNGEITSRDVLNPINLVA